MRNRPSRWPEIAGTVLSIVAVLFYVLVLLAIGWTVVHFVVKYW